MPTDPPSTALGRVLHHAAGEPPPSSDELYADLTDRHDRRRRRRTAALAGLSAMAVVAVALFTAQLGAARSSPAPASSPVPGVEPPRGWSVLPPAPLSARTLPVTVAVGTEAFVFGGQAVPQCPPRILCDGPRPAELLRDGAAYDLTTRRWRRVADAPVPLGDHPNSAVVHGVVHLLVGPKSTHLAYDPASDQWTRLPDPPASPDHRLITLLAVGDRLLAYSDTVGRPDVLYDPARRVWSPLPASPLEPAFDRQYGWTTSGLVLMAAELAEPIRAGPHPLYQRAAVLDVARSAWRRLPDATKIVSGGTIWSSDGERMVNASRRGDGGGTRESGDSRSLSMGGTLDPSTGQWSQLPDAPTTTPRGGAGGVAVDGERYKSDGDVLYDTRERRWVVVPEPPAAVAEYSGQAWVELPGGPVLFVWGGGRSFDPYADDVVTSGASPQPPGGLVATGGLFRP